MENLQEELYLVWQEDGFYNQYSSLLDAVRSEPDGAEIFKANL